MTNKLDIISDERLLKHIVRNKESYFEPLKRGISDIKDLTRLIDMVIKPDPIINKDIKLYSKRNCKWMQENRKYFIYVFTYRDKIYNRFMLYIGITANLYKRLRTHKKERDENLQIQSMFEITELLKYNEAVLYEDEITIAYMFMYGYKKVRGGRYCCKDNKDVYEKLKEVGLIQLRILRLEGMRYINYIVDS